MSKREVLIKAGEGESFEVKKGEYIKVTDLEGKQVADLVALSTDDTNEYLSTAHSRMMSGHIYLKKGQKLYSNYRKAMLELVEDTVGVHDTLYPCCDPMRYKLDFGVEEHRNCRENLEEALSPYNIDYWRVPDPVNLFQNSPIKSDGSFGETHEESQSKPGDYVIFKVLKDLVVGISACPMDLTPINGWKITDIQATISKDKNAL